MIPEAQRVAVVDDDPAVRRSLGRLLRSSGYEVDTYDSGASFMGALTGGEPDCLVLDLHMPHNGFAVQMQLAHRIRKIPVVVITGDDTPEARKLALSLGAQSFLSKPVETKELLPAIHAAINPPR